MHFKSLLPNFMHLTETCPSEMTIYRTLKVFFTAEFSKLPAVFSATLYRKLSVATYTGHWIPFSNHRNSH